MKGVACLATAAFLTASPVLLVESQAVVSVGSCDDLPASPIAEDTILELTSPEISCVNNTLLEVTEGASLEMTSSEPSTKLNNVRIWVQVGSFLSTVPVLDWTSYGTANINHGNPAEGGAAMRIEEDTTATFAMDVTFSACALGGEYYSRAEGAAIVSLGTLIFQGNAVFKDTPNAGALFAGGHLTFEKDAIFEGNNLSGLGSPGNFAGAGAGLHVHDDGVVKFLGSTFFVGNEAPGGYGAALLSDSSEIEPMVFAGPVTVSGNRGWRGAIALLDSQNVIFESLVTFTDNIMEPTLEGDQTEGGAMWVNDPTSMEFRGGIYASGNTARDGGVFFFDDDTVVTVSSPVTFTGNEARVRGGVMWIDDGWDGTRGANITLPADADISDNAAIVCPGLYIEGGKVDFEGGEAFASGDKDGCYLGYDAGDSVPEDVVEEFDCEMYSASAPELNGHPYLVLDTAAMKSWDIGIGGGIYCDVQLFVYVTGGQELVVTSTSTATTVSNVHFEVVGYTTMVLDVPDLIVTGIYQSEVGGAVFVDLGSSLDVVNDITFTGNSIRVNYDRGLWPFRGGAALFSAGTTTFQGKADFLGNGQYDAVNIAGETDDNEDGGAVSNSGTMRFMQRGRFFDSFNTNAGNGGAIANFGNITFDLRAIFSNNSVAMAYTDDNEPYGGRGGAVFNEGESGSTSSITFNKLAIFKDNVGSLGGCALTSVGFTPSDRQEDLAPGNSKVTFADKAKFKDNYCDGFYPTIYSDRDFPNSADENKGGGALLAYGATSIEFANTAVFKRNESPQGGAIVNSAEISFISDDKLFTSDNVATRNCSDILNNEIGIVQIGEETITGFSDSLCESAASA